MLHNPGVGSIGQGGGELPNPKLLQTSKHYHNLLLPLKVTKTHSLAHKAQTRVRVSREDIGEIKDKNGKGLVKLRSINSA